MRSPKLQVSLDVTDELVQNMTRDFADVWKFALWLALEVNRRVFSDESPGIMSEYATAYLLGIDWHELAQEYVNDNPSIIKGVQNARTL